MTLLFTTALSKASSQKQLVGLTSLLIPRSHLEMAKRLQQAIAQQPKHRKEI